MAGARETGNGLVVVQEKPYNAEGRLDLLGTKITPTPSFFVRSNFPFPTIDAGSWTLRVTNGVSNPCSWRLAELKSMPSTEVTATIECAGNGRTLMEPVPAGTPWGLGAVGTATFRGVRLRDLLDAAGVSMDAVQVLFRGFDHGDVSPGREIDFERSLPMNEALRDDVLVAYEMNGEELTIEHGYPARLVVPGYYGVAWVKWLDEIECITEAFRGHFQAERYVYVNDPAAEQQAPVTRMRVRSLITSPSQDDVVRTGELFVEGTAWSGTGVVSTVDVSADDGATWVGADVSAPTHPYAMATWSATIALKTPGLVVLLSRATDVTGVTQPLTAVKNDLGYGNNVVHRVRVVVTP